MVNHCHAWHNQPCDSLNTNLLFCIYSVKLDELHHNRIQHQQRDVNTKLHEISYVAFADTLRYEVAVVVHHLDASVTSAAVVDENVVSHCTTFMTIFVLPSFSISFS